MKKAKEVSIKLNTKDIQADRTDLEKTRAAQVCKMWDKFEERKKLASAAWAERHKTESANTLAGGIS
eukprot:4985607-Amphidinium_carterae.1